MVVKRWWVALIALAALALAFVLLAARDDGLGWLRTYGGIEKKSIVRYEYQEGYRVAHRFDFATLPKGLELDIANRVDHNQTVETMIPGVIDATLKDGWNVNFYAPGRSVEVYLYIRPNWLERQWLAIKRFLGL